MSGPTRSLDLNLWMLTERRAPVRVPCSMALTISGCRMVNENQYRIFETGSAKYIEICENGDHRYHSTKRNATIVEIHDQQELYDYLAAHNLDWLKTAIILEKVR